MTHWWGNLFRVRMYLQHRAEVCKNQKHKEALKHCWERISAMGRFQSILWMREVSKCSFSSPWPEVKLSPSVDLWPWLHHVTPGEETGMKALGSQQINKWMNKALHGIKSNTIYRVWTQKSFLQHSCQGTQGQHKQVISQRTSKHADMPLSCLLSILISHFHSLLPTIPACGILGSSTSYMYF